ncbi:MAG: formate dehydrogenase subunit alpha [Candidatus Glassbacteria bacterium]|nr:formate dehydrogenase subunit alpha [Candidatus Glassbacteria bacterium]
MSKTLTTCPYCGTGCTFYLVGDGYGELIGVEPATGHPSTRGQLCVKGWNAFNFVNHPDRLKTPLIKTNGKFREAGWDEALGLVSDKLQELAAKYGSDSLMFQSSAKTTNEENYLLMKLARAVFKTNNIDHCARLCHSSTVVGLSAAFGSGAMTNSIGCFEETELIFVTGSNTTEQHPVIGSRILQAVGRGTKLIVADSRTIRLARSAHLHLKHRNGTDVALLNGLMHVIIAEGLEDKQFIDSRTENYAELIKTLKNYTPQAVAEITGLEAQQIVEAARMYATAGKAMLVYSIGITQHTHGVDNVKSCANLAMLTGNLGSPGTGVNPLRGQNNVQGACDMGALPNVYSGYQKVDDAAIRGRFERAWGVQGLPSSPGLTETQAIEAAAGGTLKGLFIVGENPVMSGPNQGHVKKALEKLEFIAVQDIFPTPTTEFADVILPAACYAEKDGTFTSTERRVQLVNKAAQPVAHSRADWEIICELARRCGYGGMDYASPSEVMDEISSLTPIYGGISYKRIDPVGLQWPCPDKDHPGTAILHTGKFTRGLGRFSPVEYRPPAETPDRDYPFILSTGGSYFHWLTGTMTRRTQVLQREERDPYVEINLTDAARLGIGDRQPVEVATRRGSVRVLARVTDKIIPGVIFMPIHFEESPANALTNNALDPESKIPEYKVCAARIRGSE